MRGFAISPILGVIEPGLLGIADKSARPSKITEANRANFAFNKTRRDSVEPHRLPYAPTRLRIDTGTPAGKGFLDMPGVFAEFETAIRKERQMEGIAKAKAPGVYKGRKISVDAAKVRELKAAGTKPVRLRESWASAGRRFIWR